MRESAATAGSRAAGGVMGTQAKPDKRRGGGGGGGSSAVANAAAGSNNHHHQSASSGSGAGAVVIAPPPRAALAGASGLGSAAPAGSLDELDSSSSGGGAAAGTTVLDAAPNSTPPPPLDASAVVGGGPSSAAAPLPPGPAQATLVAQLQASVRARDEGIAQLTRELGNLEAGFERELERLARAEADTAAYWQAKHSLLHQQFLAADAELRMLRQDVADGAGAGGAVGVVPSTPGPAPVGGAGLMMMMGGGGAPADKDGELAAREAQLITLSERLARSAEREDSLLATIDELRREVGRRDDESRQLRGQVRGLKEWVSTSTRALGGAGAGGAASDEEVAEAAARLANGLQNWVLVNFRRTKLGTFGHFCPPEFCHTPLPFPHRSTKSCLLGTSPDTHGPISFMMCPLFVCLEIQRQGEQHADTKIGRNRVA